MPDYKFRTIDEAGKIRGDSMIASNPMELEKRLNSMGFDLLSYDEKVSASGALFRRKTIARRELINFTFHIEQLLKAGVPLLDCLRDIRDSMDYSHFTDVLQTIIDDIEGGKTLSLALAEHKHIFDDVYITLVRVGEETGLLTKVLREIAETLRWQDELAAHSRKIMIYPMIVSAVVLGVVSFLMMYLMPQLLPFIKNIGSEIPTHTKVLMSVSQAFIDYWYIIFVTPFALYGSIKFLAMNNPRIQLFIDRMKLKLWLFGPLMLKIKMARFANYFAMMYGSGITVLNALEISEGIMNNLMLEESIKGARNRISEGMQISESFEATGVFPSMIVRMIRIGEDTGAMDDALLNVSYFYNREVRESIDKIEPAMMPALTIILGLIMGWIMLSVLGPVYDAVANIKI
ncbi:MAG: type II secretion system F family protein [Gammaproteobacteria bacterium]|nr:type II secretion system F family protein [Gammaproteobacteria bacterium]MCW8922030.1 type II secretion system F family protein [Gammaproteobacteria bacterium]